MTREEIDGVIQSIIAFIEEQQFCCINVADDPCGRLMPGSASYRLVNGVVRCPTHSHWLECENSQVKRVSLRFFSNNSNQHCEIEILPGSKEVRVSGWLGKLQGSKDFRHFDSDAQVLPGDTNYTDFAKRLFVERAKFVQPGAMIDL